MRILWRNDLFDVTIELTLKICDVSTCNYLLLNFSLQKLEFTLTSGSSEPHQLSPENVKIEFPKILAEKSKDEIILWIEVNMAKKLLLTVFTINLCDTVDVQ